MSRMNFERNTASTCKFLDRTWILEKVFENRHERLAIETLKISVPLDTAPKKGAERHLPRGRTERA